MRRAEMPIGPRDRVLGPASRPVGLDDGTLLRLERSLRRVEPDPLFRRRMRGHVMNHYVAAREGLLAEPRPRRRMGKLGRSVLLASLAATLSISAAGAAAQDSIPGDLLYDVKLQLEDVRMRIAPPSLRSELARVALAERVEELERLAAAGAWDLVPQAAVRVTEAREELIALDPGSRARAARGELGAAAALETVLAKAPPDARHGLERALDSMGQRASNGDARPGKPIGAAGERPETGMPARPATGSGGQAHPTRSGAPHSEETSRPSRSPSAASMPTDHTERGVSQESSASD